MIKMGSFRSYVDLEEYEMKIPAPVNGSFLQPNFLPGELVIAEATNVLKFTSLSKSKGLSGSLFVTNARVVFVSSDHISTEDSFPLLSINTLWYYESSPKSTTTSGASIKKAKRRLKLGPMKSAFSTTYPSSVPSSFHHHHPLISSTRIHELFLITSNFRTLRISFKFSPIDQGLRICNSIIHHTYPAQVERLFYFDFSKAYTAQYTASLQNGTAPRSLLIPTFMDKGDWLRELNLTRTAPGGYRISGINEGFQLCGSLPEWIVVPSILNDARVMNLAEKLKGSRPPHWSWGDSRGSAILIMGKLNNEQDSSSENAFFESLRKVHPKGLQPSIYDLDTVLTLRELRASFVALVEFCCPETLSQYQDMDSKFYSNLEHTKWLILVSRVLYKCKEILDALVKQGNAIVFQEQEGRDVSCLFSSLLQILVDPRFRTVSGFFSLLQKDWVAFGHPFHSTHLHTSPVFLIFLDCVHQLINQNPLDFEFNDKLLSHLWDSLFDCTTGTFLFDSPQQRKTMELCKDSTAWLSIFSSANASDATSSSPTSPSSSSSSSRRDQYFGKVPIPRTLLNPLYPVKSLLTSTSSSVLQAPLPLLNTQLLASCNGLMCDLSFWDNLFLHRTLEVNPMIVTTGEVLISDPLQPYTPSPSSATPSPSPSSKFYFPLPTIDSYHQRRRPGRDTLHELDIVNELLQNVGATTRFQQRSYSASQGVGASSSSSSAGLLQQRHASSAAAIHQHHYRPGGSGGGGTGGGNSAGARFFTSASNSPVMSGRLGASRGLSSSPGPTTSSQSSSSAVSPSRRNPFMNLTSSTTSSSS